MASRTKMRVNGGAFWLDIALELLEEALEAASKAAPAAEREEFLRQRESIGGIEIVDIREERFRELDLHWAKRLRITEPLREELSSNGFRGRISGCLVERGSSPRAENATLKGEPPGAPVLTLHLRVETLLSRERIRRVLEALAPESR